MDRININPTAVRTAKWALDRGADKIDNTLERFRRIYDEIAGGWHSDYTDDYLECLTQTMNKLRKTSDNISTTASNLGSIADQVEKAERDLSNIMSHGSGGGGGRSY